MTNQEAYEILTSDYYIAFDGDWMGKDRCKKAGEAIEKAAKALQIVMDLADMRGDFCKDCYEKQGGCFNDQPDNKGS